MNKRDLFVKLTQISYNHYSIGIRLIKNTKNKLVCKCKCEKNKNYKIIDEMRKLHCSGCTESLAMNCWERSDYYSNSIVHKNVCKKCFEDHWLKVMRRKLSLCIEADE